MHGITCVFLADARRYVIISVLAVIVNFLFCHNNILSQTVNGTECRYQSPLSNMFKVLIGQEK